MRYKIVQCRFGDLVKIAHRHRVGRMPRHATQRAAWEAPRQAEENNLRLRCAPLGIPGVETLDVKLNGLLVGEYGGNALHH
jgi:hypothetical protein